MPKDDRKQMLAAILEDVKNGMPVDVQVSHCVSYLPEEGEKWVEQELKKRGYTVEVWYDDEVEDTVFHMVEQNPIGED